MARPKKTDKTEEETPADIVIENAVAKNNSGEEIFKGNVTLANIKEWRELVKGKEYIFASRAPEAHLLIIPGKCYYVAENNVKKVIELGGAMFPAIDNAREKEIIESL